jgi:2-polyprenyl-3-methyl-5-hydroxy-6-metoxy-1,4-benzoquinol methylase
MVGPPPRCILDVGCGTGELGASLRARGHQVAGLDLTPPDFELDDFIQADLNDGLPATLTGKYEVVLLADVLEHVAEPKSLLDQAAALLSPGGRLLVSLPNAVHWSVRAQVALGSFEYTNKGIMDRGHLRFFTRASAERLFLRSGLEIVTHRTTPVPWENVVPRVMGRSAELIERADYLFTRALPNLFSYQHLFELRARSSGSGR